MKKILITLMLFSPFQIWGQTDFEPLQREVNRIRNKGNNNVVVFGRVCIECNGSSISKYIITYDSNNYITSKFIKFHIQNGKAKKIYDSVSRCNDCGPIIQYAKTNFVSIKNQFEASSSIFANKTVVGNDTLFSFVENHGKCYFLGIAIKSDYIFTHRMMFEGVNPLFISYNNYWVFLCLLKNQWPQIDYEYDW